ncbi:alpha/beta hydrolase [Candidatus Gottesmanbacteria bacterium]|nr:alpha/beta hydrolase [Candidatus Gottesmanbacteria bacterium]
MKKPQIVILHGWGLSGSVFKPLVSELSHLGYKAYAPDMPGFGTEPAPSYSWKLRDYVRFVDEFLTRHHIVRPIFLGHSFGGRISLKYQQLHPKNVTALILTGTPGFTPIPRRKLLLFVAVAKVGKLLFSIPPLTLMRDQFQRWYYYVVGAREFFRAEGIMRDVFKNIVEEELVSSMETVRIPCLLLWGEYDIIVSLSIARHMQEVIPGAELKVIPEADHGIPFKQPDVFASYVDRFIKSL